MGKQIQKNRSQRAREEPEAINVAQCPNDSFLGKGGQMGSAGGSRGEAKGRQKRRHHVAGQVAAGRTFNSTSNKKKKGGGPRKVTKAGT